MFLIFMSLVIALGAVQAPVHDAKNYASTPQKAALQIAGGSVIRTNVWGRYATVDLRGAGLEGSRPERELILVERFGFGWQPLESLNFRCRLNVHIRNAAGQAALLSGMMTVQDDTSQCRQHPERSVDAGSPRAVEAVRRLEDGPLVPQVVVVQDYALGGWYGAGGGFHLFKMSHGRWHVVAGAGGGAGVETLQKYGVPRRSWCKLLSYASQCTASPRL